VVVGELQASYGTPYVWNMTGSIATAPEAARWYNRLDRALLALWSFFRRQLDITIQSSSGCWESDEFTFKKKEAFKS
jgi:hypothetical protein